MHSGACSISLGRAGVARAAHASHRPAVASFVIPEPPAGVDTQGRKRRRECLKRRLDGVTANCVFCWASRPAARRPKPFHRRASRGWDYRRTWRPLERAVSCTGNFMPAQRELIMNEAIERQRRLTSSSSMTTSCCRRAALERLCRNRARPIRSRRGRRRPLLQPRFGAPDRRRRTGRRRTPRGRTSRPSHRRATGIVDGVGFGCALLRVSAAATLEAPYFPVHIFIERGARHVRQCDEDYRYCERVRKAGFTVRLDARVRCEHYDRATRMRRARYVGNRRVNGARTHDRLRRRPHRNSCRSTSRCPRSNERQTQARPFPTSASTKS